MGQLGQRQLHVPSIFKALKDFRSTPQAFCVAGLTMHDLYPRYSRTALGSLTLPCCKLDAWLATLLMERRPCVCGHLLTSRSDDWNYVFGKANLGGGYGTFSLARFTPEFHGEPARRMSPVRVRIDRC